MTISTHLIWGGGELIQFITPAQNRILLTLVCKGNIDAFQKLGGVPALKVPLVAAILSVTSLCCSLVLLVLGLP